MACSSNLSLACGTALFARRSLPPLHSSSPAAPVRIHPQRVGHVIHHPLDPEHPLRAAKAAKCGRRLRVGFHPVRCDPQMIQQIGVVRMQHCAIGHRQRQILRPAASRAVREIHGVQSALVVKADIIGDPKSCRLPVIIISSSRSYRILQGAPVCLAATAQATASALPWLSLPPNPPPIRRISTRTACIGTPSASATLC